MTVTQVGLDVNYVTPQSFVNLLASQGLKGIRQYFPNPNTPMTHAAGMDVLMVLNEGLYYYDPATFQFVNGTVTNLLAQVTPQQWHDKVLEAANAMPWVTQWEFLNEPNLAGGGSAPQVWTQAQYLQYLVPTYQALKAVNPNNMLLGPTLAWPWPIDNFDVANQVVNWLQQLWSLKDSATGLTAATMLSKVSMHIYTVGYGGGVMINDVPPGGTQTEAQMIQSGLAQCFAVTGKPMVIDEFGWPSTTFTNSGFVTPSTPAIQATYYQQFMGLMERTPNVVGVFAFDWADYGQPAANPTFGVFDVNLQPQPAWSVYQQYFFPQAVRPTTLTLSAKVV